jgi:hypothetical protein
MFPLRILALKHCTRQTVGAKIHCREGNSPERQLRYPRINHSIVKGVVRLRHVMINPEVGLEAAKLNIDSVIAHWALVEFGTNNRDW